MPAKSPAVKSTVAEQRLKAKQWNDEKLRKKAIGEISPKPVNKKRERSPDREISPVKRRPSSGRRITINETSNIKADQEEIVPNKRRTSAVRQLSEKAKANLTATDSAVVLDVRSPSHSTRETLKKQHLAESVSETIPTPVKIGGPFTGNCSEKIHEYNELLQEQQNISSSSSSSSSTSSYRRNLSPSISVEVYQSVSDTKQASRLRASNKFAHDSFQSHGADNINIRSGRQETINVPMSSSSSSSSDHNILRPSVRPRGPFSSETYDSEAVPDRNITHHPVDSDFSASNVSSYQEPLNLAESIGVSAPPQEGASVSVPWPEQLVEVAEFARNGSAVMPTLPAGTLPLLWAVVFFMGVALMAYMGLCDGHGECLDPLPMLTSLGQMDGESASELFERARASVAPTADYVVEQLKQMWGKICAGEVSELSQLLTDKEIRVAVLMYLGAVIALFGGYFTYATMDYSFSDSYAQLVSSLNTTERMASVTERFEANSAAFTQWRDAATASVFREVEEEESELAPTPSISMSSFCIGAVRAVRWVVRAIAGKSNVAVLQAEDIRKKEQRKVALERSTRSSVPISTTQAPDISSDLDAPSAPSSSDRLRNNFTIYLRAKKPQILSFIQRLDVSAAIVVMLLLLLLLFLYHKTIKQIFSYCVVPSVCIVMGFGAGRLGFIMYRWVMDRRELRTKQISVCASFAKKHLKNRHPGGPYPVEFLYEDLKDLLADSTVEDLLQAEPSPIRRTSFGGSSRPKYDSDEEDRTRQVDLKKFMRLWKEVVKEVLTDKRILSTVMIFEGARRTCWKILGDKTMMSPPPTQAPAAAHTPAAAMGGRADPQTPATPSKVNKRDNGAFGWIMFTLQTLWWCTSGIVRVLLYLLRGIWRWLRK